MAETLTEGEIVVAEAEAESDMREDIADVQIAVVEIADAVDTLTDLLLAGEEAEDVHDDVDDALEALFGE